MPELQSNAVERPCFIKICDLSESKVMVEIDPSLGLLLEAHDVGVDCGVVLPATATNETPTSVQGLFARYEALRNKAERPHVIGLHRVHTESSR